MARVLIVDDAPFAREQIARLLLAEGLQVADAIDDGQASIDAYHDLEPDLVTMDLLLPGCTGIEATRQILALDPRARVLATASRGQEPLVMEVLQAGALQYVVKPLDRHTLIHAVKHVLALPRPPAALPDALR